MAEQLAALSSSGIDLDRSPDFYGGGLVAELEERIVALTGQPAAAYFPTGTMAQQVALRCWSEAAGNPTVALHRLHHTELHERKAVSTLSGLRVVWPTGAGRQPTTTEIGELAEPFSVLAVELPLRDGGFVLPTFEELTAMCAAARTRGARVHFDGARLWESLPYLGQDLPTVCALADSVYLSFYKTIGALSGAVLVGPADFIATARTWRHRYGGQLFQQWPSALSALIGLDRELPRLPEYVAHATVVAEALATLPGVVVYPNPPHTNQFQLWLPHPAERLNDAAVALAERDHVKFVYGWQEQPPGDRAMAEVMIGADALAWTAEDVTKIGAQWLELATAARPEAVTADERTGGQADPAAGGQPDPGGNAAG
jgi:threonine aldolase